MIATATVGMSQKKNVTSAIMLAKKGKYVKAKVYIDKAIKHEDTKNSPKTWVWKSKIYAGIMGSKNKAAIELRNSEDIAGEVVSSMQTTKKLDKKSDYKNDLLRIAGPMYNNSLNGGIDAYNAKTREDKNKVYENSIGLISERINLITQELQAAERNVANYKSRFTRTECECLNGI